MDSLIETERKRCSSFLSSARSNLIAFVRLLGQRMARRCAALLQWSVDIDVSDDHIVGRGRKHAPFCSHDENGPVESSEEIFDKKLKSRLRFQLS